VSQGTVVEVGEGLVVVEAMKMENELRATHRGIVTDSCEGRRPRGKGGAARHALGRTHATVVGQFGDQNDA